MSAWIKRLETWLDRQIDEHDLPGGLVIALVALTSWLVFGLCCLGVWLAFP